MVKETDGHVVVSAQGELYIDTLQPLQDALLVQVAREHPRVVLDLAGVSQCDSSGLNLFVKAHRMADQHGGEFRLAAPGPTVRRLLALTNLDRALRIFDTVQQATV
jgi:anti-sigma B factor antagonist